MCSTGSKNVEVTMKGIHARPFHVLTSKHTAVEITGTDQPGLMSEITAVLADRGCQMAASVLWTHNHRVACIIYIEDGLDGGPNVGLDHVQAPLENVMKAHHRDGERWSVLLESPTTGRTHPERRLHQMMSADRDYGRAGGGKKQENGDGIETEVTIDHWKEKGYSVVNVRSRDRPKLLFDTVCTLTDLQYIVFHAAVSSKGSVAIQEYYVRHKEGQAMFSENERTRVAQCLIAATERRVSRGQRLDVCTRNRAGLMSNITRAFRENGLSITRAEIETQGERALGLFYVTDASGQDVSRDTMEMLRQEIGRTILLVNSNSGGNTPSSTVSLGRSSNVGGEDRPRASLGAILWTQLERFSSNFRPIKS